jgi:C-terminal domain of bromodomain protein 4
VPALVPTLIIFSHLFDDYLTCFDFLCLFPLERGFKIGFIFFFLQMAGQIDMNRQSDLMAAFEETL